MKSRKETMEFQAEVRELLKLMIHSLYSNKEIFLRELVSNAADACDKLRFEALEDEALYENDPDLGIRIDVDSKARTLTVTDNGIGMSREEVIENLGTIAHSGTRRFLESLTGDRKKDANLIGQFGVGFYSAFIVADQVTVESRRAGYTREHGVRWTSKGEGDYTVESIEREARGTAVILHLREGEDEFLDPFRLRNIVRKYSDHIPLPIRMKKSDDSDEYEVVNDASALWKRPRKEIQDEEYREFYKYIAHDFQDPLAWTHNQVEGRHSYTSLFYIPSHAPFDLYDREHRHGIKLYVRRVFIMDDAEHLMPPYLRFVRGVVDSDDLPLNVSREILQHNRTIDHIRNASVKKILGLLEDLAKNDPEKYATFWKAFGRVFKEGPADDPANRERIAGLLRFATTRTEGEDQTVSLDDYLGRMKKGQDAIYYLIAENLTAARNSPHLELFRKKDIEVLLLGDRVDEWMMSHLTEYKGHRLLSITREDLDLSGFEDEEERKALDQAEEEFEPVIERMEKILGERVRAVRISHRLADSPSCLSIGEYDMSVHLSRMLAQAGHSVPAPRPYLEINPRHPLVRHLKSEEDEKRFEDWTWVLFDQALLAEGGQPEDPSGFVRRLNDLLLRLVLH
ncbi:MAG: molecular chaperone HtpG [Gammaproteobacteria bacterium]|nr:MAG: molecular chaperone HtpG [Gammaproteobacteria bacterium]